MEEDRYTSLGIRVSTRDRIVKCAKPQENWDETLKRVSSFWLSRQHISADVDAILDLLRPLIQKADADLLIVIREIVTHLTHLQHMVTTPPEPKVETQPPRFSEIFQALKERRESEGEEIGE